MSLNLPIELFFLAVPSLGSFIGLAPKVLDLSRHFLLDLGQLQLMRFDDLLGVVQTILALGEIVRKTLQFLAEKFLGRCFLFPCCFEFFNSLLEFNACFVSTITLLVQLGNKLLLLFLPTLGSVICSLLYLFDVVGNFGRQLANFSLLSFQLCLLSQNLGICLLHLTNNASNVGLARSFG